MKKLLEYLPFHFTVCLIVGIVIQFYTHFFELNIFVFSIILILIGLILFLKNRFSRTIISWLLFFFIGVISVLIQDDRNSNIYYRKYISEANSSVFRVQKVLKKGTYYEKYIVEVVQIDNHKTIGKCLLNIQRDSVKSNLEIGSKIFLKPDFRDINKSLNPHQFDYKKYLEKQGVSQQVFVNKKEYKVLDTTHFSIEEIAFSFREKISGMLSQYNFSKEELSVINALLLGKRSDISKELITDYSRAGAIHILAVSGLHVGIVLLILSIILKPLERLRKGKVIKTIIIVLLLWSFAFIAGLSASVVRAVTMFTAVVIGQSFQRKSIVEHSLIISMFVLLLWKPMFVFDVGFQLSYLAVFGIIWIQPMLYEVWKPKWKLINYFWKLSTVSIAAQIGVLPISLYYFHQFPGLFMLSNYVIIPFLGVILIGGFIIIILGLSGILPSFLVTVYGYVIGIMNRFVSWIANQEQFLFQEISVSFSVLLGSYVVIILFFRFCVHQKMKLLFYLLGAFIVFQTVFIVEKYKINQQKEFIVFHQSRKSLLGIRTDEKLLIYGDQGISKMLTNYRIGENVSQEYRIETPTLFRFKNQHVLRIDSLGVYEIEELKNPIVILQNSPRIHLERLILKLKPAQIIADGSNYKSDIKIWKTICKEKKTPFHFTGENGAYILK